MVAGASGFALSVAFGLPCRTSVLGMEFGTRGEAILPLFDVELKQKLNHILVTIVGERPMSVDQVIAHEREWQSLIEQAMTNRAQGRPLFNDGSPSAWGP